MPKYIFDLEKSLDFSREISHKLTEVCETTDCIYCKYSSLCTFNINMSAQLYLLKQKRNNP